MTLYDVMVLVSLGGGFGAAYGDARHAGESTVVTAVALLLGMVAGVVTVTGFNHVGRYLQAHTPYSPDHVPTLREEFPFILLYLGLVAGVVTSITLTSMLVRLTIHRFV